MISPTVPPPGDNRLRCPDDGDALDLTLQGGLVCRNCDKRYALASYCVERTVSV